MAACNPFFQSCVGGSSLETAAYIAAGNLAGYSNPGNVDQAAKAEAVATTVSLASFGLIQSPSDIRLRPLAKVVVDNATGAFVAVAEQQLAPVKSAVNAAQKVGQDIGNAADQTRNALFIGLVILILLAVMKK